ncbi:MAG: hypothetical protein WC734_00560 [Patescibacteria group bacterium]|jgi:hypothetical protein
MTDLNEQPQATEPIKAKPHPKHKGWVWAVIIIFVLLLVIGATGLVSIPVISSIFNMNKPKDLGIKASPEALASIQAKVPVEIIGNSNELCLACKQTYDGQIAVTAKRTSEEMTSFLQLFPRQEGDILKNTQVRFIEGGMEISTKLNKYISAPIYVKVMVNRTGTKTVDLRITNGKVGLFNVPSKYLSQANEFFTKLTNDHLAEVTGFSMDKLEYHAGYSDFSGTYPKTVKPSPGQWTDVF